MFDLLLIGSYISCFLGILCFFIVLLQNKFRTYPKILLLCAILSCTIVIALWCFYQGKLPLLVHAHLALFSGPFYFLPGMLLYLYIKSILIKTSKFKGLELLHFTPILLNIILLIPYWTLPVKEKQNILLKHLTNTAGPNEISIYFFSAPFDVSIKLLSWMVYYILIIKLIYNFKKTNPTWIDRHKGIWYWIKCLTAINILTWFIYILIIYFAHDIRTYSMTLVIPPIFLVNTSIIILFFKPSILYGIREQIITEITTRTLELSNEKVIEYKGKITFILESEKVFLKKNYTLKEMSEDLDIPLHHLSYVLNKEWFTNFQNFINKERVLYFIKNRHCTEWENFSLEGAAMEVGFSSRNTFFKAFKNVTGKSPSEYFKTYDNIEV